MIAAAVFVRLRLADVPLERDEGEYAYAGHLILEGVPPYKLAYNMKFPGTYYAYALILAGFGESPRGIHTGLALANAASIWLVFLIGRRLIGDLGGAAAASSFAVLSIDRWIMGVFAHATHFVILAVLAGLWLLLFELDKGRLLRIAAAGSLFGIAILMKQHAVFFLPAALALLLWEGLKAGALAFATGCAAPMLALIGLFAAQGVLGTFWFWTFRYASTYVTAVPLSDFFTALSHGFTAITARTSSFWTLAAVGLVALWIAPWPKRTRLTLTGLSVGSFLAICPGLYFREHYFIVMLPAVALLIGVALVSVSRWLAPLLSPTGGAAAAAMLFLIAVGLYVVPERGYLFRMGVRQLSRERYGSNPFIESVDIGRYIREHTAPGDRVSVLGSEPQIYFYSGRRSASGYVYMDPLMEDQPFALRMQKELIQQTEAAQPKMVVFAKIRASWLAGPKSDQTVVRWADEFIQTCYDMVGVADIYSKNDTKFVWGPEAAAYTPVSKNLMYVFQRKAGADCRVSNR